MEGGGGARRQMRQFLFPSPRGPSPCPTLWLRVGSVPRAAITSVEDWACGYPVAAAGKLTLGGRAMVLMPGHLQVCDG